MICEFFVAEQSLLDFIETHFIVLFLSIDLVKLTGQMLKCL